MSTVSSVPRVPTPSEGRPRVIFLDVDGTLVTYANELPPSAVRVVRRARAAGHRVYPTTGRSRAEFPQELEDIGFDGFIGANGSYVEDDGEVVAHCCLSQDTCAAVTTWLTQRGLPFYLEANSGLYASPDFLEGARDTVRAYLAGKGDPEAGSATVDQVFHGIVVGESLVRQDVNKISYVLSSPQDLEAAAEAFPELKHGSWGGRGHEALFGDLGVAGITKSEAVDILLGRLGADLRATVAFGDATVDVDMLEHCAVGVAMGNGSDEVKAAADLVTKDVEEDGLAHAFEVLGLLG